jgi:hypothetical protein
MISSDFSRNAILARLKREPSFAAIQDRFTCEPLEINKTVQEAEKSIRMLYFPLSGMLSTVADMNDGSTVEICCVGCQGMVNWEALLGASKSRFRHFGQLKGEVASVACKHMLPYATHPAVTKYVVHVASEVSRTAACNCLHSADERLARWLLLASDKNESNELGLTQEFMAMMLGSRRSTVTIAAGKLQDAGLIRYVRGRLNILNREGLIGAACECYGSLRAD